MRGELKAWDEGRASMDAGVVPTLVSGVDPHSGEEVDLSRVMTGWSGTYIYENEGVRKFFFFFLFEVAG